MSKFCKDCQFWLFAYDSTGDKFGTCDHPIVEGKVLLDPEPDEYVIHTDQYFGCIYHTPLHGNVVAKIDPDDPTK